MLGQPVLLELLTADSRTQLRPFHGHVTAFERLGSNGGLARYRLVLEPWLAFLRQRVDSYVFQDMTVLEIVEDVFADYAEAGALAPAWRWELADRSTYARRSLTTQYEESDFAFLQRLLAEEGIFGWFEHAGDAAADTFGRHTLVLADHGDAFADAGPVRYHRSAVTEREDGIQQWSGASSGVGYTGALYTVLLDATGRSAVCDFLEDCLCADPNVDDPDQATTEAILLRGMVYNQDELARQWNEAASAPYEPRGGWEAMAARLYRAFRKKLSGALTGPLETRLKNLSQYSYEFSGASLRRLQRVYDLATGELIATIVERRTLVMIGMLSKHESPNLKLVEVRTRVNRQQTTQILARAAAAMSGDRRAMLGQRGALHELFDPLSTEHLYYQGVLLVDETQVSRFNGTIPADQFDAQMRQNLNRLINRVEAGTHFVTALLAVWTLGSAWEAMRKEPGLKSTMGFAMGLGAIAGPLMEGTGAAVRSSQWGATKLARPIVGRIGTITTRAAMVGFAGKMIGVVGAVVGGVLAMQEGIEAWNLSRGYAITMIGLGVGMIVAGALMILAASSPVGFVLALVIALIMFVVGFLKKDEIEKWLDQVIGFGHHKQGEFDSIELQLEAMQAIGQDDAVEGGAG